MSARGPRKNRGGRYHEYDNGSRHSTCRSDHRIGRVSAGDRSKRAARKGGPFGRTKRGALAAERVPRQWRLAETGDPPTGNAVAGTFRRPDVAAADGSLRWNTTQHRHAARRRSPTAGSDTVSASQQGCQYRQPNAVSRAGPTAGSRTGEEPAPGRCLQRAASTSRPSAPDGTNTDPASRFHRRFTAPTGEDGRTAGRIAHATPNRGEPQRGTPPSHAVQPGPRPEDRSGWWSRETGRHLGGETRNREPGATRLEEWRLRPSSRWTRRLSRAETRGRSAQTAGPEERFLPAIRTYWVPFATPT